MSSGNVYERKPTWMRKQNMNSYRHRRVRDSRAPILHSERQSRNRSSKRCAANQTFCRRKVQKAFIHHTCCYCSCMFAKETFSNRTWKIVASLRRFDRAMVGLCGTCPRLLVLEDLIPVPALCAEDTTVPVINQTE